MIGRKKRTDDTTAPSDPVGHLSGSTDAELFSNMVAGIHYHVGMSVFITQIKTAMQNLLQAGEPNFKRCMRADEDTFIFLKKMVEIFNQRECFENNMPEVPFLTFPFFS